MHRVSIRFVRLREWHVEFLRNLTAFPKGQQVAHDCILSLHRPLRKPLVPLVRHAYKISYIFSEVSKPRVFVVLFLGRA